MHPEINKKEPVYASIPKIDRMLCDVCGECTKFCQFNAIFVSAENLLVFPELCHSCGGCALVCPKKAITWEKYKIGALNFGVADGLSLVFGELDVSKPLSVPVIKAVKKQIKDATDSILDSPPGTSCPFVETVSGSDFCLLVTEPTPFGLHDLKIAVEVLRKVAIPFGVVVNRAGIGDKKVYDYCREENIRVLLEIPYERRIAELYSKGVPFSLEMPEWAKKFQMMYNEIVRLAKK